MFVGHGVLAFAIAAAVARWRGWSPERALAVGVLAAGFGTLPDVDMLLAPLGLFGGFQGIAGASTAFWEGAETVHRSVTHSLVVGSIAALALSALALASARPERRWARPLQGLGLLGLVGLVAVGLAVSGGLAAVVLGLFVLGGFGLLRLAARLDLGPGAVAGTAFLGLLSHPFGDLVTGGPPALLYPLEWGILDSAVVLHPDPTLNLLGAFFLELATLWIGLLVLATLQGWRLSWGVRPRAGLGVGYAGAVALVPSPTLERPTAFVVTVLGLGLLGAPIGLDGARSRVWQSLATALTAVTLAALAYLGVYLLT